MFRFRFRTEMVSQLSAVFLVGQAFVCFVLIWLCSLCGFRKLKDVRVNGFCASLQRTQIHTHVIHECARWVIKWIMIGQMAIAIAFPRFSGLGRSVTPTFLSRISFRLQLSPSCPKMNKKSMWEVKKISRFLSTGHGILPSCGGKVPEAVVAKCKLAL